MATHKASEPRIGIVLIGRNEGERLKGCIESVAGSGPIVYVDSGSSDGSADWAKGQGAEVVALDMTIPFTAARARNEGFARMRQLHPSVNLVQFVDGDCSVVEGWLASAASFLETPSEGRSHLRPTSGAVPGSDRLQPSVRYGMEHACGLDTQLRR